MENILILGASCLLGKNILSNLCTLDSVKNIFALTAADRLESVKSELQAFTSVNYITYDPLDYTISAIDLLPSDLVVLNLSSISRYNSSSVQDIRTMLTHNFAGLSALIYQLASSKKILSLTTFGSSWQNTSSSPTNDNHFDLYAVSKSSLDLSLSHLATVYNFAFSPICLYDNFGSGDTRNKITNLISNAIRDEQPLLMSPGFQTIDLSPVTYQANLIVRYISEISLDTSKPAYPRCISGYRINLHQLIKCFEAIHNKASRIQLGGRPYREREIMNPLLVHDPLFYEDIQLPSLEISLREVFA